MACADCNALISPIGIDALAALQRQIRLVRARLNDGSLRALPSRKDFEHLPPFSDLEEYGLRPDWFSYRFQCSSCDQCFELAVEAYHGSGGEWHALV